MREEGRTTLRGRRGGLPCEGGGEDYLVRGEGRTTL